MRDLTVVTGYFSLGKSKHSTSEYESWIRRFCRLDVNLVVFCSQAQVHWFKPHRQAHNTRIIPCELDQLDVSHGAWRQMWHTTLALDPEKSLHGTNLYAVWAAKQELVRKAIDLNFFDTTYYAWMDAGLFRHERMMDLVARPFSHLHRAVQPGRMLALQVVRISDSLVQAFLDRKKGPIEHVHCDAIGGGVLVGDSAAWTDFGKAYLDTCLEMHASNQFVGKDQSVFLAMQIYRKTKTPMRLL
jgi:hypothetical protein